MDRSALCVTVSATNRLHPGRHCHFGLSDMVESLGHFALTIE